MAEITTGMDPELIAGHVIRWYSNTIERDACNERIAEAEKVLKSIGVILPGMSKKQRSDAGKPKTRIVKEKA